MSVTVSPGSLATALDRAAPGDRFVLLGGDYYESNVVVLRAPGVTVEPAPGARPLIHGRVWIQATAYGVHWRDVGVDGSGRPASESQPTFMVNAVDFTALRTGVTNQHSHIGWNLGGTTYGRADRATLIDCMGYDCGRLTDQGRLHDHGLYIEHASDFKIIRGIYSNNASRGIQLYPDAQGGLIMGAMATGNRQGLLFGGGVEDYGAQVSNKNTVVGGVYVSNSEADIDSWWSGLTPGAGNTVSKDTTARTFGTEGGFKVV